MFVAHVEVPGVPIELDVGVDVVEIDLVLLSTVTISLVIKT